MPLPSAVSPPTSNLIAISLYNICMASLQGVQLLVYKYRRNECFKLFQVTNQFSVFYWSTSCDIVVQVYSWLYSRAEGESEPEMQSEPSLNPTMSGSCTWARSLEPICTSGSAMNIKLIPSLALAIGLVLIVTIPDSYSMMYYCIFNWDQSESSTS